MPVTIFTVLPHVLFPANIRNRLYKTGAHTITATLIQCGVDLNTFQEVPTGQILATTTLTINVLPDHHPKINTVELTQAIQELQQLPDLESDLEAAGEPLVPVIANKPAVLRVYMQRFDQIADIRVDISGPVTQTKSITLQPECVLQAQRRRTNGCQSVDFYFTPPIGSFPTTVTLFDINGNTLESHTLSFESRKADKLILHAVSVCDSKNANGVWQCAQANALTGDIGKLRKLAPTDDLEVQVPGLVVRKEFASFGSELNWWTAVVKDVNAFFGVYDLSDFFPGTHGTYFGMVRPNVPGGVGGITYSLPSRGAAARTSAIRFGIETVEDVIAHETGHSLGGHHTNTDNPVTTAAPGCYNLAADTHTDWPFSGDNRIQSATQLEVGFDVNARKPIIPDSTFDIMSYCIPRWISPFHYRQFMSGLGATSAVPLPLPVPVLGTTEFWTISGIINNNSVQFDPLFQLQTVAPLESGTGDYQINIIDSSGALLFTRFFTPANSSTETAGPDGQGPPTFSELIPVMAGAAQIVLRDPTGAPIGQLTLGGTSPAVQIITPAPGATLTGIQTISWNSSNPNNRSQTTKVLYSPNNGARWIQLDQVTDANTSIIDFDTVPGGIGSALIRLLVSDGINTGSAISAPFTVSKKTEITAQILTPEPNAIYQKGNLVMLTAGAYNVDNGVLDGPSITWSSDLDGVLGNGAALPVYNLEPGTHQITMSATDRDNNFASQHVTIRVAGAPPTLTVDVHPLESAPSSCVQVTINAAPGSIELSKIDYSLDNGDTFKEVPLISNPYTFTVPGSGAFHLIARAFDAADQIAVKGAQFTTSSPCQLDSAPPVTSALVTPLPNASGWNNSNVSINLNATDNLGGSGVQQISFSAMGAQPIASTNVAGNVATALISTEGVTNFSFFAMDLAGNLEPARSVIVKLDKTPPLITGARTPPANANGWNNTDVTASFNCSDALSGLAPGTPPASTVVSTEGANQQVTGTCQDLAGNSSSGMVSGINIDKTPPALSGLPAPNCTLWPPNHKFVTVATVSAADLLSGMESFDVIGTSNEPIDPNDPDIIISGAGLEPRTVQLRADRLGTGTGRIYTLTITATDTAGNTVTSSSTCTVPHDQSGN